ncbi:unnamed protein product [Durusdinium trenchii]
MSSRLQLEYRRTFLTVEWPVPEEHRVQRSKSSPPLSRPVLESAVDVNAREARQQKAVEVLSHHCGFEVAGTRRTCGCVHAEFCACGHQWKLDRRQRQMLRIMYLDEVYQLLIRLVAARAADAGILPHFADVLDFLAQQIRQPGVRLRSLSPAQQKNLAKYLSKQTCEQMLLANLTTAGVDWGRRSQVSQRLKAIRQALK